MCVTVTVLCVGVASTYISGRDSTTIHYSKDDAGELVTVNGALWVIQYS